MNLAMFLAASALGMIVWWQTGSVLFGLFVWVIASAVLGIATGLVRGDIALGWDGGDSSDCGGSDGGGGD